jgi:hypothetical protein
MFKDKIPMKKHLLILCLLATTLSCIPAQTTILLPLTAELNGNHQPLDSILIQNLTPTPYTHLFHSLGGS